MSVETELGLGSALPPEIAGAWASWAAARPVLAAVGDPRWLRSWLQDADVAEAGEVVHELAWLASTQGGDDREARCETAPPPLDSLCYPGCR